MLLLKSAKHVTVPARTEAIISTRLTNRAASRLNSENVLIEPFLLLNNEVYVYPEL